MKAYVVVDLLFGDAGKGLMTDYLVRSSGADLVVRYNGGAQAGHQVTTPDGRRHTFAQFGAGSFVPGVRTFLSRHVVIHPSALLVEAEALAHAGVEGALTRLWLSEHALLVTPYHQALNRMRECARGSLRHGSCGAGIGAAVEDSQAEPEAAIRAADLRDPEVLERKLSAARNRLWPSARNLSPWDAQERGIFEEGDSGRAWLDQVSRLANRVVADHFLERALRDAPAVVFEGAQGVLLDAWRGFHPYTTWSNSTDENARGLLAETAPHAEVTRIGVLRSHAVRHGPGPLPTETQALAGLVNDHNAENQWQGPVRYGWFDAVLARHALALNGGVDALAITHLDLLKKIPEWRFCRRYDAGPPAIPAGRSIAALTERTRRLFEAVPEYESLPADHDVVLAAIEQEMDCPVGFRSAGATHQDVGDTRELTRLRRATQEP